MPHEVRGSELYTATEICERALRMIGAFSINDSAAQPNDLYETVFWLDMMMANEAGSGRCHWLMRDELSITLESGTASYDLAAELAQQLKTGVQFPVDAVLKDANGNRRTLDILPQKKFRETVKPDTAGTPTCLFIDRLNGPTLHVYPVPTDTDEESSIILTVQTFAESVKPRSTAKNNALGNERAGFRQAWNLWAVCQLAAYIGNGPVRALPTQRVNDYRNEAAALHLRLEAFENRDHDNQPPIARASSYR